MPLTHAGYLLVNSTGTSLSSSVMTNTAAAASAVACVKSSMTDLLYGIMLTSIIYY
jgi:hypothetical protein